MTAIAGYTRTNHVLPFSVPSPIGIPLLVYPDVPNNYTTRLELRWPIYTGGRTDALERAARAEAEAVGAERQTAQADLRLEVTRAYWALVTARASLDVLEQGVARSQAHVNDANQRFTAGLVPPNEVVVCRRSGGARADAGHRSANAARRDERGSGSFDWRRARSAARADRRCSRARRRPSPGQRSARSWSPLAQPARSGARSNGEWRRPMRNATRPPQAVCRRFSSWAAWTTRGRTRRSSRAPIVAQDSWDVGVGATWSLWDGGRTAAEVAQARAVSRRQASGSQSSIPSSASKCVSGRSKSSPAVAAVAAATSGVTAAADARRVVDERYRAGVIAEIEVLDAEYALLQAQLDLTRAQAGVRLAEARLTRALGR